MTKETKQVVFKKTHEQINDDCCPYCRDNHETVIDDIWKEAR